MKSTIAIVLFMAAVGFGVWGILIWRASTTTRTQANLCGVLYRIIEASDASLGKPGAPGFVYYRDHPEELRAAHRANKRTLNQLPCQP
jgi:hypothetical protein